MRNKIFLTSIIAMMVVYAPAFAYTDIGHTTDGYGYIGLDPQSANGEVMSAASCLADPLRYDDNPYTYGTYTFTAQWDPDTFDVIYKTGNCQDTDTEVCRDSSSSNLASGQQQCASPATGAQIGHSYTIKKPGDFNVSFIPNEGYHFAKWSASHTNGSPNFDSNYLPDTGHAFGVASSNTYYTYDATDDTIDPASIVYNVNGNLTLTAVCEPNVYTVTYDCNGGTLNENSALYDPNNPNSASGSENVIYGTIYNFGAHTPSNTCVAPDVDKELDSQYWDCTHIVTVNGVTTTPAVSPNNWPTESVPTPGSQNWYYAYNVTCRATWKGTGRNIRYKCGKNPSTQENMSSSDTTIHTASVTNGSAFAPMYVLSLSDLASCSITNGGYTFKGWECDHNISTGASRTVSYYASNPQYPLVVSGNTSSIDNTSGNYSVSSDTTCHAVWEANVIRLVWETVGADNNADVQDASPTTCNYGTPADASFTGANPIRTVQQPQKAGYTFKGWKIESDGWCDHDNSDNDSNNNCTQP